MDNQQLHLSILALSPIIVGVVGKVAQIPFSKFKSFGLMAIVAVGLFLGFGVETDSSSSFLASAVLLSCFSVMLSQEKSQQASEIGVSSMAILGLALGALLAHGLVGRLFLCGLLGFAVFSLIRTQHRSFRTTLIIIHFIFAIILSLSSIAGGQTLQVFAGLFLSVTFLPLVPFHLPFVGTVGTAKGGLSSLWIVVWLAVGLAELNSVYLLLKPEALYIISLLALFSAIYASLAALGQKKANIFVASATVAHVSLMWGLLNIFPNFSKWGFAFGIAVAFVLGGLCLAFSFIRQRYGWQLIGKLPGLASPMPRFGTAMVLLVSFALFLPTLPAFTGLTLMATIETADTHFLKIFILFFAVWVVGGWFFLQMLHQTAFGTARSEIPYSDLRITEVLAVTGLLLGAGFSGFIY